MKTFIAIISCFVFSACINESSLNIDFPTPMLHGHSAKVWTISESSLENDENVAELEEYRKSFIFYSNETFREQALIHLGSRTGEKGSYKIRVINNQEVLLTLSYGKDDDRHYIIRNITNHSLTLESYTEPAVIWKLNSLNPPKL